MPTLSGTIERDKGSAKPRIRRLRGVWLWLFVPGSLFVAGAFLFSLRAAAQQRDGRQRLYRQHYDRGHELMMAAKYSAAIDELQAARRLKPDDFQLVLELAGAYQMANGGFTPPRVVQILEEYVRDHPTQDTGLMELGIICAESYSILGYTKSEKYLRRLLKRRPNDVDVHFWLASTLLRANKLKEALPEYETVLKLDPERGSALYGKAIILYKLNDLPRAAKLMRFIVDRDPLAENRLFLYRVYEKWGRLHELPPEARLLFKGYHYSPSPVRFQNVGRQAGVDKPLNGRGSGWEDYDGDGLLDLSVASSLTPLSLYRNDGSGGFVDVAVQAGLAETEPGWSQVWADYDNDGFTDLFVGRNGWGGAKPKSLFHNNGDGTFTDVATAAGVLDPTHAAFTAAWGDYDNDGFVDLYVANFDRSPDALYHNNRDGTFTNVADAAGVADKESTIGSCWGDYDNDGWLDIYAVNLNADNHLYRNRRNGTFEEVTKKAGVALPFTGYVTFFLDFDNDGWLDLFASGWNNFHQWARWADEGTDPNILGMCRLFRNQHDGTFADVTVKKRLQGGFGAMAANFGDVDSDGRQDIYLACGGPEFGRIEESVLFLNQGNSSSFANISRDARVNYTGKVHGVSLGDYDNDGALDIFVPGGAVHACDRWPSALYHNEGPKNHWLVVKLIGRKSNRDAIGATLRLWSGGLFQHLEVSGGCGFGATNSRRMVIGLGKHSRVDRLEISWPVSHSKQLFSNLTADQALLIEEGKQTYRRLDYTPLKPHAAIQK